MCDRCPPSLWASDLLSVALGLLLVPPQPSLASLPQRSSLLHGPLLSASWLGLAMGGTCGRLEGGRREGVRGFFPTPSLCGALAGAALPPHYGAHPPQLQLSFLPPWLCTLPVRTPDHCKFQNVLTVSVDSLNLAHASANSPLQ